MSSTANKLKMAEAITGVLTATEKAEYADLRDEWARRQMMKAAAAR